MSARRLVILGALGLATTLAGCDPQKSYWGFDALRTMQTPADPALVCGQTVTTAADSNGRAACSFGTGALATDTLGISDNVLKSLPIRHVILVMKENRSFDHLLGKLHEQGQPGVEAMPGDYANPDKSGASVPPYHETNTCLDKDPEHQSAAFLVCSNGGKWNGYVRNAADTTPSDGHFVMGTYEDTDLPFYYFLARTFAVSDRHFAPMASGTYANRNFLLFGTNGTVVDTGIAYPSPTTPSVLHTLLNAGYTWGAYSDGAALSGTLNLGHKDPGVHSMQEFLDALDAGTLPNVAFVDGIESVDDDHPTADIQRGEATLKKIYDHAIASPQWQRTAILWTYDEGGAFADHVLPPDGCQVSGWPFKARGTRIPLVAISPWAKRNYASHVVTDHTAITRFIEALFGLPALTARDANSDGLFDLFDFSCAQKDVALPAAPAPGTGGCQTPTPEGTN